MVFFRLARDVVDEGSCCLEEEESCKTGGLDCAGGSRDQATDSEWSSFLFKDRDFRVTGRCCSGAGVISGSGCRAGGSFRGSGGTGGGCKVLVSGVEVDVKICFKICSEDCVEGEFQVIGKVKGGVKIVIKDGQC